MSHSQGATMPRQVSVQPSITEAPSLVAICQSALGDRKCVGGARFDLDVANHADPALFIRNTHVVAPGSDILQAETLVMIDRSVGIVLALIRSPVGGPRRSERKLGDRDRRQIPEPQPLGGRRR